MAVDRNDTRGQQITSARRTGHDEREHDDVVVDNNDDNGATGQRPSNAATRAISKQPQGTTTPLRAAADLRARMNFPRDTPPPSSPRRRLSEMQQPQLDRSDKRQRLQQTTAPHTPVAVNQRAASKLLTALPAFDSPVVKTSKALSTLSRQPQSTTPIGTRDPVKRNASPQKTLLASPPSARAKQMFDSLAQSAGPARFLSPHEARNLLDLVPKTVAAELEDGAATALDEENAEFWSPRKKKGGFVVMGLAARAQGVLSASKTAQSLWLHSVSRQLSDLAMPLEHTLLVKALRPDLRVQIVQVFPFGAARTTSSGPIPSPSKRDERRVAVTRCRVLAFSDNVSDETSGGWLNGPSENQGLVIFSLHEHPATTAPVFAPPATRKLRADTSVHTPGQDDSTRSLCVPINPHDLRFSAPGTEVWLWQPLQQVVLPGGSLVSAPPGLSPSTTLRDPAAQLEQRAVVCNRFAFLL
ncbi:hypothetical protein ACM66B_006956 [Microbotryomycetes sp. NB124-2]